MITLSKADAIAAVRKNLDEQGLNESVMYSDENTDNDSLDLVIAKTLPEAINEIQRIAPAQLLEGESIRTFDQLLISDNVLSFTFDRKYLRLAAFQAVDSDIVVTEVIPESDPEGRKQLNKYIRGTYDNPRLVKVQGAGYKPSFRYYSLRNGKVYESIPASAIRKLMIVPRMEYATATTEYQFSADLLDNVINKLTAMVLYIYKEGELANYFNEKSTQWKTL